VGVILNAVGAVSLLFVVFLPLEKMFAAHEQRVFRKEWGTDLLFCLGQYLLWTAPVVVALKFVHAHSGSFPLAALRDTVGAWPIWLQFAGVIVLCDVGVYWAHRMSHSIPFLWRFHRVHHTAERLDWIAAYREHPVDNLYTRLVENLPAMLFGFPIELLAGFAVFRGLWAIYIHSNVTLDPGPLRHLLGSSRLNHWHHDIEVGGRVNFANLSPLMDHLFGTYHDPGRMPERYGLQDDLPHGYVAQLVGPLIPRAFARRGGAARYAAEHATTPLLPADPRASRLS
jgi:sterol desaturase/sphingolipid hydroxylase (fatty acid hydroxylase superfamily)